LIRLKAASRVNEGFTTEEVEKLQEIYDELEKKPGTTHIKVSQLSEGLLQFEGLYCIDQLTLLMKAIPCQDEEAPPVTFWEFLVWARRLRYAMTRDLFEIFAEEGEIDSGMISTDAVVKMTERVGFTLPPQVLDCLFKECDLDPKDTTLNFNSAVAVVRACRENNGFTPTEIEEHTAIFEKFDIHGNGSLTGPQVLDLLRYRGYRTTPQQVDSLIRQVDFNDNGTMEIDEFLRLMRLMRECYICEVAQAFNKAKKKARDSCDEFSEKALWYQTLALEAIPEGIKYLGEHRSEERLKELMSNMPDQVLFTEFLNLADACREASTVQTRRRAGFTDEVYQRLARIFMRSSAESSSLSLGSMLSLLAHAGLPVNTADGRREMFNSIEAAREAAADAGSPAELVGSSGSQSVGYPVFVQLVKLIVREDELKNMKRETDVLREAKIDSQEAAVFRRIFTSLADELKGKTKKPPPSDRETLKDLLEEVTTNRTLNASSSTEIVKLLQLRVSAMELESLSQRIRVFGPPNQEGVLDFACFVQMMRWMTEKNFANINSVGIGRINGHRDDGEGSGTVRVMNKLSQMSRRAS
jgi:calmodulin